jgi:hypothetical protein
LEETISDAIILRAERLFIGAWGDDAVLALVFELPDGRSTTPTYLPGRWQVHDFLEMIDVPAIEDLAGTRLRVVLTEAMAATPGVSQILPSELPETFRQAFPDKS